MTTLKNSVRLIGYLETEPEFEDNDQKVRFSLATVDTYTDEEGRITKTYEWHNIVAYGETAAYVAENLNRGTDVTLEGRLTYHKYVDTKGNNRFITEIIANDILVLEKNIF